MSIFRKLGKILKKLGKKLFRPKFSLGIDFGTTMTRISYIPNEQQAFIQPRIMPIRSVICPIKSEDENRKFDWYVGEKALQFSDYFTKVKLQIGTMQELTLGSNGSSTDLDGNIAFRPEILAARIIWLLLIEAETIENNLRNIRDVTITVPAEWNFIEREATILAARIAGFSNVNVIEEPIAAFIALSEFYKDKLLHRENKYFLVFDCGGGTLDITVIHRPTDKSLPIVIGRSMDKDEVSGEHIDECLSKYIVGEDKRQSLNSRDKKRLLVIAKRLKESLNPTDYNLTPSGIATWPEEEKLGNLSYKPNELKLELSTLNNVLEPMVKRASNKIEQALKQAGKDKKDIDIVLLVGGSSYLRPLQDCIKDFFYPKEMGKQILLEEPERAIAMGAAMHQSYLDRGIRPFTPSLAMDTYLEYEQEKEDGSLRIERLYLGKAGERLIPQIAPKFPEILPLPKNRTSIQWKVYQERSHARKAEEVEHVLFEEYKPDLFNRLRLEYKIDFNGNLSLWRPRLIGKPYQIPKTGSPRRYDWAERDPKELASEFGIQDPIPTRNLTDQNERR